MQPLLQGFRPYLLLTLLCALLYGPGLNSLPVMDRDEARYMQATRQMQETGDYIQIRFLDEARNKKPVGVYWLQAAAVEVLSHPASREQWVYRLPAALAAWLAVLLTFRFASTLFDPRIALVSGAALAGVLIVGVEAHLAKTDATLLALTTLTMGSLGLLYMQARGGAKAPSWAALAFWLALGAAILVKGPVTPMIVLLAMAALWAADRKLGYIVALRPVMGIILVTAVVAPWLVAVSEATGGAFLSEAVGDDLLPKLIGGHESHGAPPGYYLLLVTVTLWPASLFLWPALWRSWKERALPGLRFCLAWVIPAWIVFELIPTKLPHYTLPLYPALVMMIATALFAARDGTYDLLAGRWAKAWYGVWSLVGLALAGAALVLPFTHGEGFSLWSLPAALAALAAVGLAWWFILHRRFLNALAGAGVAAGVAYVAIFGGLMGDLSKMWVSERLAQAADTHAPGATLAVAGYHEPSLVFLMGTNTVLTEGEGAARFLLDTPNAVAAVEDHQLAAFHAVPGTPQEAVAVVEGLNYSRGRPVRLHVFTVPAGHTPPLE